MHSIHTTRSDQIQTILKITLCIRFSFKFYVKNMRHIFGPKGLDVQYPLSISGFHIIVCTISLGNNTTGFKIFKTIIFITGTISSRSTGHVLD